MTDYQAARKRVEDALAKSGWKDQTYISSLGDVTFGDLRTLVAGAPPVTVEEVAEAIRENVGGPLVRETIEEAAEAGIALLARATLPTVEGWARVGVQKAMHPVREYLLAMGVRQRFAEEAAERATDAAFALFHTEGKA